MKLVGLVFASLYCALVTAEPTPYDPKLEFMFEDKFYENNTYTLYVPVNYRPGRSINFICALMPDMNSSLVGVTTNLFLTDDGEPLVSDNYVMKRGETAMISTEKVPMDHDRHQKIRLEIMGFDMETGEDLFFNETSYFTYEEKTQSIFVQTDKAIYQPGQTVKFRAACVDDKMVPRTSLMTYEVVDPKSNVIMLKKDQSTGGMGVVSDEIEIHHDSPTGFWTLTFTDQETNYKESLSFEVYHYKLPKFEVDIVSPSFVHKEQDGITIKLTAKYTYGKPVMGDGHLMMQVVDNWDYRVPMLLSSPGSDSIMSPDTHQVMLRNFNGEAEVFMSQEKLTAMGWLRERDSGSSRGPSRSRYSLKLFGSVKERYTDIEFNSSRSVRLVTKPYRMDKLYAPSSAKPGLLYTAYLKVTEPDGSPLMEDFRRKHNITITYSSRFEEMKYVDNADEDTDFISFPSIPEFTSRVVLDNVVKVLEIPPSGEVVLDIEVPDERFTTMSIGAKLASYSEYDDVSWEVDQFVSPTNSYLQIIAKEQEFNVGSVANFEIRSSKEIDQLSFMVKSRGNIINVTSESVEKASKTFNYQLHVTADMQPSALLLCSYVTNDDVSQPQGELVADFVEFDVMTSLANRVSLMTSSEIVDAGDGVSIGVVTSHANSYVGLKAVDKSVLLVKEGNDVTMDKVREELDRYEVSSPRSYDRRWWWWWPVVTEAQDVKQLFEHANLNVMTDAYVHSTPKFIPISMEYEYDAMAFSTMSAVDTRGDSGKDVAAQEVRSYFPETWLWEESVTGDDKKATFNVTAPDTITSWVINAFSLSPDSGLGIADKSELTVFRNFFVSLNLPLKVVRGEIIIVQALVFNYFKMELDVTLKLHENARGFELIRPSGREEEASEGFVRKMKIGGESSQSVWFPVRMTEIGDVEVQVTASSTFAADSMRRNVRVKSEGIEQCFSESVLLRRDGSEKDSTIGKLQVRIPDDAVVGSQNVKLYMYGDIMGSTMSNLGKLLREPTGCGEQNMQSFAPDVFVTSYLQKAGKLDDETRRKAYKHFVQGHQNQLNYRHDDGSYSAFGSRDKSGSLWLTAFVAKCFAHAALVRPEMREQLRPSIESALDFIEAHMQGDGSYVEPGRVSAKYMQGGVDSPITMAAYVLIALTEAYRGKERQETIEKTTQFLESNLDRIKSKPYALTIVTYALHTAGSSRQDEAFDAMRMLATESEGHVYWHERDGFSSRDTAYYYRPPSNDIEMTSYALMTYVLRGEADACVPMVRWLTSKRNRLGGYSNTQNTVIAIQALSSVAALMALDKQDMSLTANMGSFGEKLEITDENSLIYNRFDLPNRNGTVTIEAEGSGVAIAQLSVCYNVIESPIQDSPFNCSIEVGMLGRADDAVVSTCCSLKDDADDSTGMLVYEVGLPNGFTVDLGMEKQTNGDVLKRVERKDGNANYYYDELRKGDEICSYTSLKRESKVGANKPSTLIVFDYYQPERRSVLSYSVSKYQNSEACNICGSDCVGCPAAYLTEWVLVKSCRSVCEDDYEEYQRNCFDPNLNEMVDPYNCGVDRPPTKQSPCNDRKLPFCPDVHEGMWGADTYGSMPYSVNMCSRTYDYGARTQSFYDGDDSEYEDFDPMANDFAKAGIPAVSLSNGAYMQCQSDLFSDMDMEKGFTLSLLVNVNQYPARKFITLFSYGVLGGSKTPNFHMTRNYMGRKEFRFVASVGTREYRVTRIPSKSFVNNWVHLLVTWHPKDGHGVYLDGESVGFRYSYRSRRGIRDLPDYGRFLVGKSTRSSSRQQAIMDGHVSSLALWNRKMEPSQASQVYRFYQPLLTTANGGKQPILTSRMLYYFAQPIRGATHADCFQQNLNMSDLLEYSQMNMRFDVSCAPYF